MTAFSITYDLTAPGRNYEGLYEAIKKQGTWWHYLESTWLVSTNKTASQVWSDLSQYIDKNDNLLIIEVRDNVSGWLPKKAWEWIHSHVPN